MTHGAVGNPLVTVVTVCRDAASTLEICLNSVATQTYAPIEHVIIDGASTDGTAEILARYHKHLAVVISEPDKGLYDAMNKGIALARGEFVIFMNADDHFAGANALYNAMAEIANWPDADVYYGSLEIRAGGVPFRHVPPSPDRAAEEMVLGCLPHQSTLTRRAVFARTGPFDLRWRRHADYEWWLKIIADPVIRVRQIRTMIASFASGGTSSDLAKGQPEVFAIQNASSVYASHEWDRRRIELFQQAWLTARIEVLRLREEGGNAALRSISFRSCIAQLLPGSVVMFIRTIRGRRGASTVRRRTRPPSVD